MTGHSARTGEALSKAERAARSLAVTAVYGEIKWDAFVEIFRRLRSFGALPGQSLPGQSQPNGSAAVHGGGFVDFGSGVGKALFAAALLHGFKWCRGIELLSSLHQEVRARAWQPSLALHHLAAAPPAPTAPHCRGCQLVVPLYAPSALCRRSAPCSAGSSRSSLSPSPSSRS